MAVSVWKVTQFDSVFNNTGSAIAANLCLVPDATANFAGKVPATSSAPTGFLGVTYEGIAAGKMGNVARDAGDVAVIRASGTVTRGDTVVIDTATGKEGRVKTNVADGVTTTAYIVGVAQTTASDGQLVSVVLAPHNF